MVFILRFLICLITLGPRIVRIELVIGNKLNKMQFRYWGANNCGYKCIFPLGGSEWIISVEDYVDNSFTALGVAIPGKLGSSSS